jgi:hypothetical protein
LMSRLALGSGVLRSVPCPCMYQCMHMHNFA